ILLDYEIRTNPKPAATVPAAVRIPPGPPSNPPNRRVWTVPTGDQRVAGSSAYRLAAAAGWQASCSASEGVLYLPRASAGSRTVKPTSGHIHEICDHAPLTCHQ